MPSPADLGDVLPLSVAAASGYLLGSLPFGFLVARSRGVNIFEVGSRSSGATNVRRVLGAGPGRAVFALDTLKGAVAAGWPLLLAALWSSGVRQSAGAGGPPVAWMVVPATHQLALVMGYVGLGFALVGHSFSCFTGFRGGKGVSTAAGGFLVLLPCVALISSAVWVLVFYPTRYVSLASILAALCLPLFAIILGSGAIATWVTAVVALFVVVRHRANVKRLLTGTEKKFERKKPDGPPPGAKP